MPRKKSTTPKDKKPQRGRVKPTPRKRRSEEVTDVPASEMRAVNQPGALDRWPTYILIIMAALIAFGLYLVFFQVNTEQITLAPTANKASEIKEGEITYRGVDGKTALSVLKDRHQVETKKYDFGEFVVSIDGRSPQSNEYWIYYVNGTPGTTGADAYVTKPSDVITWRIEQAQ